MPKNDRRFAINACWTAVDPLFGWRHFRIVDRRWRSSILDVEIMAVCDRGVRTWLEATQLLDAERFRSGWPSESAYDPDLRVAAETVRGRK